MTKTIAALLAFAMLAVAPASAATEIAAASTSALCGPDAPESYKRAGGYCDEIGNTKSLAPTSTDTCANVADAGFRFDEIEGRLLVAVPIDPCCNLNGSIIGLDLPQEPFLVAARCLT